MQKSAQNTLSPPSSPAAECAIQSYTELQLLYHIYRSQNGAEAMYDLVRNPVLGMHSSLGQNDWDLANQVLTALSHKGMWKELKSYTESILFQSTSSGDQDQDQDHIPSGTSPKVSIDTGAAQDLVVWNHYVESVSHLGNLDCVSPETVLDKQNIVAATRGRALARCRIFSQKLELLNSDAKPEDNLEEPSGRDPALESLRLDEESSQQSAEELRRHIAEECAVALRVSSQTWFEDMKPYLEKMTAKERAHIKGALDELVSCDFWDSPIDLYATLKS